MTGVPMKRTLRHAHMKAEIRAVSTSQAMPRIASRPPATRGEDMEKVFLAVLKWKPPR